MIVRFLVGPNGAAIAAAGIAAARGVVIFPIATKLLPIPDYGLWAQLGVAATLLSFLALAGLDNAVLRYLVGARDRGKDQAFSAIVLSAVGLSLVVAGGCLTFAVAAPGLDAKTRGGVTALGALVVGLVAERLAVMQLRRLLAMWSYAAAVAVFAAGDALAIGSALFLGFGLVGAIAAWGALKVALAAGVLLYSGLARGALASPAARRLPQLLAFGLPFIGTGVLNWVLNLSDRFLVGWLLGVEAVALYSASYALGGLVALPFGPIFLVVQPQAAGLWEDGRREDAARSLWRALEWSVWAALPGVAAIALWAPEILGLAARPEYAAAATSAAIVAVAVFVQMLSGFAETEIGLIRRSVALTPPFLAAAITNVAANLVLLPWLGYVGAALATLLAAVVLATWTHAMARRGPGWVIRIDRILVAVSLAAIAAAVLGIARPLGAVPTVAFAVLMLAVYASVALRLTGAEPRGGAGRLTGHDVRRAFASELAPWAWGDPLDVRYALLDRMSGLSGRVLDLGCGPGILLADASPGARAYGIDSSPEALRAARRIAPSATLVRGDFTRLPFADASFDAAVAAHVIQEVADHESVAREVARVLRPGGLLLLTTPNAEHRRYRRHLNKLTTAQLRALLAPYFDLRVRGFNPLPTQRVLQRAPSVVGPLLAWLLALPIEGRRGASIYVEGRRAGRAR